MCADFNATQHVLKKTGTGGWTSRRRALAEVNSTSKAQGSGAFFDTKRDRVQFPQTMDKPQQPKEYPSNDPYKHLGLIGYTRNTYQFKGRDKDDNNIYGGQHMKKTLWLEEMRRKVIAEREGISPAVDDSSVAGTGAAYYLNERTAKNPYYHSRTQEQLLERHGLSGLSKPEPIRRPVFSGK